LRSSNFDPLNSKVRRICWPRKAAVYFVTFDAGGDAMDFGD
jgi:hypothetical protein